MVTWITKECGVGLGNLASFFFLPLDAFTVEGAGIPLDLLFG